MGGYGAREGAGRNAFAKSGSRPFHGSTARLAIGEHRVEVLKRPTKVGGVIRVEAEVTLSQARVLLDGESQKRGQRMDALPGSEVWARDDAANAEVREPFGELVGLKQALGGKGRIGSLPGCLAVADQVEHRVR